MSEPAIGYYWKSGSDLDDCCDEYEVVFRPDGSELTVLTEPEDRWCARDVGPLIYELNRLRFGATGERQRIVKMLRQKKTWRAVAMMGLPPEFTIEEVLCHFAARLERGEE